MPPPYTPSGWNEADWVEHCEKAHKRYQGERERDDAPGDALHWFMEQMGFTQKQLSLYLGYAESTRSSVYRWLHSEQEPTHSALRRIMEMTGIPPSRFFNIPEPEMTPQKADLLSLYNQMTDEGKDQALRQMNQIRCLEREEARQKNGKAKRRKKNT